MSRITAVIAIAAVVAGLATGVVLSDVLPQEGSETVIPDQDTNSIEIQLEGDSLSPGEEVIPIRYNAENGSEVNIDLTVQGEDENLDTSVLREVYTTKEGRYGESEDESDLSINSRFSDWTNMTVDSDSIRLEGGATSGLYESMRWAFAGSERGTTVHSIDLNIPEPERSSVQAETFVDGEIRRTVGLEDGENELEIPESGLSHRVAGFNLRFERDSADVSSPEITGRHQVDITSQPYIEPWEEEQVRVDLSRFEGEEVEITASMTLEMPSQSEVAVSDTVEVNVG